MASLASYGQVLVAEVLERLARLQGLVVALEDVVGARERDLLKFYSEQLWPLRLDAAMDAREPEVISGEPLADPTLRSILSTLLKFYPLHRRFALFTRFPEVLPEVRGVVEKVLPPKMVDRDPAVVYSPLYGYFESNINRWFDEDGLVPDAQAEQHFALQLPYSEFRNPLAWPNLVHELGHLIAGPAVDRAIKRGPEPMTEVMRKWGIELFCDLLASRAFGPAYFCAFSGVMLTLQKKSWFPSESHPQPNQRLQIMAEYLEDKKIMTESGKLLKGAFQALTKQLGIPEVEWAQSSRYVDGAPTSDRLVENILVEVEKIELGQVFSKEHAEHAGKLVESLRQGIPLVAGYRETSWETVRERLAAYNERKLSLTDQKKRADAIYDLLACSEELPATNAEILTAAWEWKLDQVPRLLESVRLMDSDRAVIELAAATERLDNSIIKSLETSSVHRMLRA